MAFYDATDGDNWTNNEGWLSDRPLDEWHGVTTDHRGNVIQLWLSENNLSGLIPAEVGQLASLIQLDLGRNQLTGSIPPEIGQLSVLTSLDLRLNRLAGGIPPELGNLESISYLNLTSNELSGEVPNELGTLTELVRIFVSGNELEDCIPDELKSTKVNDFDDLAILYCTPDPADRNVLVKLYNATDGDQWEDNTNWLSDKPLPTWYGVDADAHGKVTSIDLRQNNLNGTLISEVGQLADLTSLSLGGNQLTGNIPTELAQLTGLTSLDLGSNRLVGAIPTGLGMLRLLSYLGLASNELTGGIPSELGNLTGLQSMFVAGNEFDDCIPDMLQPTEANDFDDLNILYCTHNTDDRDILVKLYKATSGDEWNNNQNWLSDEPLPTWHGVDVDAQGNVAGINLPRNNLNGPLIPEIGKLAELSSLLLDGNALTGKIPEELGNLVKLQTMRVVPNRFDDCTIPDTLQLVETNDFENLDSLCALVKLYDATKGDEWHNNDNWFSDKPLPTWHGLDVDARSKITGIDLRHNNLSGPLIPEVGQLTDLTSLNLGGNQLTGTIPTEIGNLRLLEVLDLQDNDLSGTIPTEIGKLNELSSLVLNGNTLTGKIPEELGKLAKLQTIRVYPNRFEDCAIPDPLRLVETNDFNDLITVYCTPDPDELAALVKLYNATNGDGWRNNENWLSDLPLAAWHGVEVNAHGQVTGLDLVANRLNGSLIPEIGQLAELRRLHLYYNNLRGNIPVEFAKLNNLRSLNLESTWLTGTIPVQMGRMTNLEHLNLSRNALKGAIPHQFAKLGNLVDITLASNRLTGEFPMWLGDLRKLEHLHLNNNRLTGDLSMYPGGLGNIQTFNIVRNNLTGCIPETLREIKVTDFVFSSLDYCDNPLTRPPTTPEFIKWVVGDAVRKPHDERSARLGVQWLFEYAESVGWPIVEDDITVYFMTDRVLEEDYALGVYGTPDTSAIAIALRARKQEAAGIALPDSNFSFAPDERSQTSRLQLYSMAGLLIHENIHTAFQSDIAGLYTSPLSHNDWTPRWFSEGMAAYFTYLVLSQNGAWSGIQGEVTNYECPSCEIDTVPLRDIQLLSTEMNENCEYICGAFAIELLASIVGQRHIVDLYTMRQPGQTWEQAFEAAFGVSVSEFSDLYDQHREAGFPALNPPIVPETGR